MSLGTVIVANATRALTHDNSHTEGRCKCATELSYLWHSHTTQKKAEINIMRGWPSSMAATTVEESMVGMDVQV